MEIECINDVYIMSILVTVDCNYTVTSYKCDFQTVSGTQLNIGRCYFINLVFNAGINCHLSILTILLIILSVDYK